MRLNKVCYKKLISIFIKSVSVASEMKCTDRQTDERGFFYMKFLGLLGARNSEIPYRKVSGCKRLQLLSNVRFVTPVLSNVLSLSLY
jgi:hypothetical protein